MTSSTSLIISGSSAEVGSSKSITLGCMARARGNGNTLLLTAGELTRVFTSLFRDPHPLQHLHCEIVGVAPGQSSARDVGRR